MDVHTRGEQDVHTVLVHFLTHCAGDFLHEGEVPGAGEKGSDRESGAVESLGCAVAGGADAQAGRAVRQDGAGDAEAVDRAGVAGGAGHFGGRACGHAVDHHGARAADQQRGLLLEGHSLQDLIDVVFTELGLCECRHGQKACGDG